MAEISELADTLDDFMNKLDTFLSDVPADDLDEKLTNLRKNLKAGNWPGDEDPGFSPEFLKNFTGADGNFTEWINELSPELDEGGKIVQPLRLKAMGLPEGTPPAEQYFSARDIRQSLGSEGPRPNFQPWLLGQNLGLGTSELDALGDFGRTTTLNGKSIEINDSLDGRGGHKIYPTQVPVVGGPGVADVEFYYTKDQLNEYALGRFEGSGTEAVDNFFSTDSTTGQQTTKLKGFNLGYDVAGGTVRGNESIGTLKAFGMVDEDGNVNFANTGKVKADVVADALDTEGEKRWNTQAVQNEETGVWESNCGDCCGEAFRARGAFSKTYLDIDINDTNLSDEERAELARLRKAGFNYRDPGVTDSHSDVTSDNLKKSGMSDKNINNVEEGFKKSCEEGGINPENLNRVFRSQADLNKLENTLYNRIWGTNSELHINEFKAGGFPLFRSLDAVTGKITPPPLAYDLDTLKSLERIFADMRLKNNPLFDGENGNDAAKATAKARIKLWRQNHGLGGPVSGENTEGWFAKGSDGKWEERPGAARPKDAMSELEKFQDDPDVSKKAKDIAKKVKEGWSWYHYLGMGFLVSSLGELLLSHGEAMSGCFLVPLTSPGQGQEYLPSYKINPMTCLQRNKTWGSGYFLGVRIDPNDWFGTALFGTTPNSKGGNVQAAQMCLRGGKCDKLSFPTANFFQCGDKNSPGGWRAECPKKKCLQGNSDTFGYNTNECPGNQGHFYCFPNSSTPGVAAGGKTYFYDYATNSCTEDLTCGPYGKDCGSPGAKTAAYGRQWTGRQSKGPPDGCNFVCSSPAPTQEYFETNGTCGPGAQNCAVGQTCDTRNDKCVSQNKTCITVGDSSNPAPGSTLSDLQASPGYCMNADNEQQYCNPTSAGADGTLVSCEGTNWADQIVYTNCKTGGINFATGPATPSENLFNGFCASKEYRSNKNMDGGTFGPFGIDGIQVSFTDTVMPTCYNNPDYANPGFSTTDYTTTVNPDVPFHPKARDGTNYLTCVLPQEAKGNNMQYCTTDSDCVDPNKQQVCVGSYGGKVPTKSTLGNLKNNMNPGFCVDVNPCPANAKTCLTDTNGNKYLPECTPNSSPGKISTCHGKLPGDDIVTSLCAMPTSTDASKAKPGESLGTRGVCLSIDKTTGPPIAKRWHASSAPNRPNTCYNDTADACSNYCRAGANGGIQVPPGYTLDCRSVGLLGAAADWFGQAVGPFGGGGDPFGGITKILMWIGIILGVGIVILGILSLFIKRLESALFSWM